MIFMFYLEAKPFFYLQMTEAGLVYMYDGGA